VRQFSTGCTIKTDAATVGATEDARIRSEFINSGAVAQPSRTIRIKDCIIAYKVRSLTKPVLGDCTHSTCNVSMNLLPIWRHPFCQRRAKRRVFWLRDRGAGLAPSTIARWHSTLLAAPRYGAHEYCVAAPDLRAIPGSEVGRIAYLTPQQEARLLAAYSPWAARGMIVLCETGLRTQEALRLDWRPIDWQRGAIMIENDGRRGRSRTKSGKSRGVGMRPVVRARYPRSGSSRVLRTLVLCSSTNLESHMPTHDKQAAIPLHRPHRTAWRKAGIKGF
jgi:hypothetical protein